ncbi:GMC family oxidoreductase [Paraburkholderia pallida]|uniref:Dehydrogenase n=1 Tax=Paraburkholderia pallida TaxID=2547399 RepID=A0A4V1B030_9BURK|nr:GMC family oxidoreductase N-terminal domain-containing protein [Paraburkholderia pallida]QBR01343.1 dehydrogenase [Paraburkholderia pallida]
MASKEFDYVIVGAGSAGCALAYRLGADPNLRILVLEAGGHDRSPTVKVPLTWGLILKNRLFDWGYFTEPEPGMNDRKIECARGKIVGGSSSINGMAYARGAREDYDAWARDLGLSEWSYEGVLPYFKRSESWEGGESALRGGSGPLTVIRMDYRDPLIGGFLHATRACGYPANEDYNGESVEGFGPMQATIRKGLRCSAAVAYLRPALARGNVTLVTQALVEKVMLEKQSGTPRATGVVYRHNGETVRAHARREVILSGGVINSPQLLMLSGIGPASELASHGLDTVVDLPGVGRNLHDHIVFDIRWRRQAPGPLHRMMRADRIGMDVVRTFFGKGGFSSKIPAAAVGLIRSQPHLQHPDIQLILAAGPMNAGPYFAPFKKPYTDAFSIKGIYLTPESRGLVRLGNADPSRPAIIEQNFLATEADRRSVREMFYRMREIGAQAGMQAFIAEELSPGPKTRSDADVDSFIRQNAITLHHPVGTCRMGPQGDAMAVLDSQMRVRGVDSLRVVDGSAMPRVVRGPTNAPILMMAERAADYMLGKHVAGEASTHRHALATATTA